MREYRVFVLFWGCFASFLLVFGFVLAWDAKGFVGFGSQKPKVFCAPQNRPYFVILQPFQIGCIFCCPKSENRIMRGFQEEKLHLFIIVPYFLYFCNSQCTKNLSFLCTGGLRKGLGLELGLWLRSRSGRWLGLC